MPDISTPNLDYGNMVEAWDINDALMGGTLYMRQLASPISSLAQGRQRGLQKRLAVATLLPAYEETIKQNIGRVFAEPISWPRTFLINCASMRRTSTEGTRLDVWAQSFFGRRCSMASPMRWWTIRG